MVEFNSHVVSKHVYVSCLYNFKLSIFSMDLFSFILFFVVSWKSHLVEITFDDS